jgi:hypothetical protein
MSIPTWITIHGFVDFEVAKAETGLTLTLTKLALVIHQTL